MFRLLIVASISLILTSGGSAQPKLRQSFGVNSLPKDNDRICPIGTFSLDFSNVGLRVNDTAYDFTLYDAAGNPTSLSDVLSKGKPVLLISGSFTCPVFRNNARTINNVFFTYGKYISTYVIYTLEAHPIIDPSPYGANNIVADQTNEHDNVLYRQPQTYADRKSVEHDMSTRLMINAPVLLDAPCNQWMLNYGPAPNIAYLIDVQGIVRYKEPWLNLNGASITNDIDQLLSKDTIVDKADTGLVTFELTTNDTIYTTPGKTVSLAGKLVNSSEAAALVHLLRHNSSKMPAGWSTAMCTDICLSPEEDKTTVRVPGHSSKDVTVYFYVGKTSGTGRVYIHFSNQNVLSDSSKIRLVCIATSGEDVRSSQIASKTITIVPNPATEKWSVRSDMNYSSVRIYDMLGRIVSEAAAANEYRSQTLARGVYRLQLLSSSNTILAETTLVKQ